MSRAMGPHTIGRNTLLLAALLAASSLIGLSVQAQQADSTTTLFIVEFTRGPSWLPDRPFNEQPHAADHSANLRRLREAGMLVLGARHGSTGMVILRGRSEADVRSEIEKDQTVAVGVFVYSLEEFSPFYGGCVETGR